MLSLIQEYGDLEHVPVHIGRTKPRQRLGVGRPSRSSSVTLMQMSAQTGQAARKERPPARGRPRGKRILLVDDQQNVREAIRLVLRLDNHAVIEADGGAAALDLFRQDHFDLSHPAAV